MSMFLYCFEFLMAVMLAIVLYFKWTFRHWKNKKIAFPEEPHILFGNLPNPFVMEVTADTVYKRNYDLLKLQGQKYGIMFFSLKPLYMPIDPEYIKDVMVKNFSYFEERGIHYNDDENLAGNLLTVKVERWRYLRAKLTPAFTPAKMKFMFNNILQCCYQLQDAVEIIYQKGQVLEMKEISSRYTTNVIGSCAFGVECNTFKDPNAKFRRYGKTFFEFDIPKLVRFSFIQLFPDFAKWLGIKTLNSDLTEFYTYLVRDTVKYRKSNNVVGNDMFQLLLELQGDFNLKDKNGEKLNEVMKELAPEVFLFFMAGYNTSSLTITVCLAELALNQEIQNKLREEIMKSLDQHNGQITYESMDITYLNQVIDETLRKYPPIPVIPRECSKDYQIPGTDIIIKKGTVTWIPNYGLHNDPEYYPEPERFDPERFNETNRKNRIPFTYLPFGEGPKYCIGKRFGLMQIKIGLIGLLKKYRFTLNKRTQVPIQLECNVLSLMPKEVYLNLEKL